MKPATPSELFLSSVVRLLSVRLSVCKRFTFSSSSQEPLGPFQPNLAQSILGFRGFQFAQIRTTALTQRRWIQNSKNTRTRLRIFFSKNTEPISTKLRTKHPWVKGMWVCSNNGPRYFPSGDNDEVAKIHWRNLKIFIPRSTGSISTKLLHVQSILG